MPLQLQSLRYENPGAPVLVILHGLLGSSRNWTTIGRALQVHFDVHAIDLRNHGNSPHADSMFWVELCVDLQVYLDAHGLKKIHLIGHSLGGKIAMRYACQNPLFVTKLVIIDIAAKVYPPHHENEFIAMKRIPLADLTSRKEAEELLESLVPDWAMRQFLLTNLVRDTVTSSYKWQANIGTLHASLPHIRQNSISEDDRFLGPCLLVRGTKSIFLDDNDADQMRIHFPQLIEKLIPGAGHNVHAENRAGFLAVIQKWL